MTLRIALRPYQPADWARLCEIHDLARIDELQSSHLRDAFLSLEETAESEGLFDGAVTVALLDNDVQGFVAFADNELNWLYVHPLMYRRGIGKALLRHALDASAGSMSAEVLVGNDNALKLYLSEGFRIVKRVDGKLTGNEQHAASGYVLQRHLAGQREQ